MRDNKKLSRTKDKENRPLGNDEEQMKDRRDKSGRGGDLDEACRELNNRVFPSC